MHPRRLACPHPLNYDMRSDHPQITLRRELASIMRLEVVDGQPLTRRVRKMLQLISAFIWLAWLVIFVTVQTGAEFKLLNPHSQTKVGRMEKFVAADAFKEGNRIGGHTLTAISWNFRDHFLAVVEQNVPEATLKG